MAYDKRMEVSLNLYAALTDLMAVVESAINSGDWSVNDERDPSAILIRAKRAVMKARECP